MTSVVGLIIRSGCPGVGEPEVAVGARRDVVGMAPLGRRTR